MQYWRNLHKTRRKVERMAEGNIKQPFFDPKKIGTNYVPIAPNATNLLQAFVIVKS